MSRRLRTFFVFLCAATAILGAVMLVYGRNDRAATEDSPGWDCASMGNGVCGPVSVERWVEQGGAVCWMQVRDSKGRPVFGPYRESC